MKKKSYTILVSARNDTYISNDLIIKHKKKRNCTIHRSSFLPKSASAKEIIEIKNTRATYIVQVSSHKSHHKSIFFCSETTPLDFGRWTRLISKARSWRGLPRRKGRVSRTGVYTKNGLEQWLTVGVAHKLGPIKERRMEEAARSKTCT